MHSRPASVAKILSENDVGGTGAHQAGILVPKDVEILSFFPRLDSESLNPRLHLRFSDSTGEVWVFAFIHYNNKRFGGTRDEYRLTRMTTFLKRNNAKAGETIVMRRDAHGKYLVELKRLNSLKTDSKVLKLGSSWKVIDF